MISQSKNRVQAIKSKFENLNSESAPLIVKKNTTVSTHLNKHTSEYENECNTEICDKENSISNFNDEIYKENDYEASSDDSSPKPNTSYLYSKNDLKRGLSDSKKSLTRQTSDPGKKLHRSHAFRCDRSQKIVSPQRHGSCNGRSETSDFKMGEKKLSNDRLKRLGNLLEDQMKKENFIPLRNSNIVVGEVNELPEQNAPSPVDSIPDSAVPQHILDQYAKVVKPKKKEDKQDTMTDSGVSSETENLEEEKTGRIKKLMSQFEKAEPPESPETMETDTNLENMNNLCISSETMRLERKNPHLTLTDTLKKALKQPLPPGPPPKKPPRVFAVSPIPESPEKQKKDTKKMLEKLERVLQKREAGNTITNEYDKAETNLSVKKPKEIHYLCTEILDIAHRTLLPNTSNCFKSLNCAIVTNNSTLSLPYTRLSTGSINNRNSLQHCCSCSNDSLNNDTRRVSTFLMENKCSKCMLNDEKHDRFQCHLDCKCKKSEFFVEKEHIYDVPFTGDESDSGKKDSNKYGSLNQSKSLEDLRCQNEKEDNKIYDIPCDVSRPATPDAPKTDFQKLRQNFEMGFQDKPDTNIEKPDIIKNVTEYVRIDTQKCSTEKPPMKPKPAFVKNKMSKSTDDIVDGSKCDKKMPECKNVDTKRYRKSDRGDLASGTRKSLIRKDNAQLDVDKENLNRLMNEIYETVTAACNMDNKPGSFPIDQSDGNTSEDSVKLTRSLTEKRKNYVRRVSSRVAYLDPKNTKSTRFRHQTSICSYKSDIADNPYSTFRSWKCFRTSQNNLNAKMEREATDAKCNLSDPKDVLSMTFDSTDAIDNLSIDEKTGCVDIGLPFEPRERGLFNVCLLVGLNYMTGQAYVKSVFPSQVQVPPHIENLIFPETLSTTSKGEWSAEAKGAQCYSLVLTDERGERSYGYCRRVLPEGATTCLPLCYCLIGKYRAPGFYYKVLQEIESHHGSSDVEIHSILTQLFDTDFPNPGEEIKITYSSKIDDTRTYRHSLDLDIKCKTMPDMRRSLGMRSGEGAQYSGEREQFSGDGAQFSGEREQFCGESEQSGRTVCDKSDSTPDRLEFYDLENNNGPKKVLLSFEGPRTKCLKRPIEPRIDEDNLSVLLECLGAGLTIKVFSSLLLERKVLIMGDKLSLVSSCMEALQALLYPLVWQQPLISAIPREIQRDVLEAPLPILAGMLAADLSTIGGDTFEEGMLIDLNNPSKVIFYQGDESTILPTSSYKTLKTSLHMEARSKQQESRTKNVMISEAFLRFFVDILGEYWRFLGAGQVGEGGLGKGSVVFDKESFIKSASSKQNQYFLEWFTETAMFNHFVQNMAATHHQQSSPSVMVDTPLPDFYQLFEERVKSKSKADGKGVDAKSNYKSAMNKKVRLLKTKLRELVA